MEVIEDGNIMDRIPILLQRDLEYYQTNQTVLSEKICPGVVGGRLDFPRTASFAAVKIVIWLEEEFSIAFKRGSGMFVITEEDDKGETGVAKTSDPDKFVQLAIKSADMLLEHLHVLAQEALDHADLPVLTATLGAAALLRNALNCYVQLLEDSGSSERHSLLSACYKRYVTMSEAVAERVLDLHTRVLSLYVLQDEANRAQDSGQPSIHGWWLYMQGTKKDLWDTVPPRIAQRIFAGMLNETLTILTVRYCQTNIAEENTKLLINNIMNILLCAAQLLPAICTSGSDLAGLEAGNQTRDVRDVHAKCNELFKCMVFRGAELHFIHQAFKDIEDSSETVKDCPQPWFAFVSPKLFDRFDDVTIRNTQKLCNKTAIGLELQVLLAQPQPSWCLLVKILTMRDCYLSRALLTHATRHMTIDNMRWSSNGLWYAGDARPRKCKGFLCTADGFCKDAKSLTDEEEYCRAAGALTYILSSICSKQEIKSSLMYALEISGRDWSACLDKRQVWCDRRPSWLAAILSMIGSSLQFIPGVLVKAIQTGASMYQTMSVCLSCISRVLGSIPNNVIMVSNAIQEALPTQATPVGNCVLLQLLLTVLYEDIINWAKNQANVEKKESNGEACTMSRGHHKSRSKHVRIVTTTSSSVSFDGSYSSPSCIALAIAEALCCIDEDDKHTEEITQLIQQIKQEFSLSNQFGLEDFPEFAMFLEEGTVAGSSGELSNVAASLTTQLLMTPPGRDSLRVIYDHIVCHSERIYNELGIEEVTNDIHDGIKLNKAPLLYIMFHIGRKPFDQYLRNEWPMPWSRLCRITASMSSVDGARIHVMRRPDMKAYKNNTKINNQILKSLYDMFKTPVQGVL